MDNHYTGRRPGQLGDTGIIVLQHCGPLRKEGCECSTDVESEVNKAAPSTASPPASRFSKTKTRSFKPRTSNVRSQTSTTTSTTERSALRTLFNNRSRIYRSKRLTGNQRY